MILSEYLCRRNDPYQILADLIPAVRVKEARAVFVRPEIEPQRPRTPEKIDVPIPDTACGNVNESR